MLAGQPSLTSEAVPPTDGSFLTAQPDFRFIVILIFVFLENMCFHNPKKFHTVYEWHCKGELMVGRLPSPTQSLKHNVTKGYIIKKGNFSKNNNHYFPGQSPGNIDYKLS